MDKRTVKGRETADKIIDTAIDIISESGITGVSAGKIAQRADISKSNLFHHFPSVDDILLAVLTTTVERMLTLMNNDSFLTIDDFLSSIEAALFSTDREYKKTERVFFAFYHASLFSTAYTTVFKSFLDKSVQNLEQTLLHLNIAAPHETDAARFIIALLDGLSIQINITNDPQSYHSTWQILKKIAENFFNEVQK